MRKFLFALVCLLGLSAQASLNNQNNPHVLCVPLGSPSADDTILAGLIGKQIQITGVSMLNEASIAASNTDFVQIELRKGATVVAELDSRAAHENGLAASTKEPLNLVSAQATVAADSVLSVVYNETDTGTVVALTGAVLCLDYWAR